MISGAMKPIRILLADDHTVVRKGLRLLLESVPEFQVIADAANGREAVALAEQHRPDVVVMDVAMPILNGIEAARQITAKLPQTAIVFLSMHGDESYVLRALKSRRAGVPAEGFRGVRSHSSGEGRQRGQGVFQSRDQQDAGGRLHAADAGARRRR